LRQKIRWASVAAVLAAIAISIWVIPWDLLSTKPWTAGLMAMVILMNTITLRQFGNSTYGHAVPLMTAIIWGGSTTALAVLSHSARFGDLTMMLGCALTAVGIVNWIAHQKLVTFYSGIVAFISGLMLETPLNTYSDIPVASYVLVAVAPGIMAINFIPRIRRWTDARPIAIALMPMIVCAIAVGLAARAELWK
jgi:hypothetical protein